MERTLLNACTDSETCESRGNCFCLQQTQKRAATAIAHHAPRLLNICCSETSSVTYPSSLLDIPDHLNNSENRKSSRLTFYPLISMFLHLCIFHQYFPLQMLCLELFRHPSAQERIFRFKIVFTIYYEHLIVCARTYVEPYGGKHD
jgi:hypothetical protein